MRKILTTSIFLLVLLISNKAEAQNVICHWVPQNSGTTNLLYTCKAVSDKVCWAAGANETVRLTTNGGGTWINANPNPGVITGDVRNMEAIDENNAWVTTETSNSTTIYKTSNRGETWVVVYSNTTGLIKGIRMINPMNGIALGSPINNFWNLLITTDGGNTWHPSPNQPAADIIHQGTHNSFQVDMPHIYWGTSLTSIFRSTNSGITYTENSTPGGGIYIFSTKINSNGIGFAAGTGMSRTTDGGITFQADTVPGAGNIDAIENVGNNFWYVRGANIYRSTNDGNSWGDTFTAPQHIRHMDIPDSIIWSMKGWAVGAGGNIYHMDCITVGVTNVSNEVPEKFSLGQNYPNPFNPTTKIGFELPENSDVKIVVYNISGKVVDEYKGGELNAGKYEYEFNGEDLSSGVYFYRFEGGGFTAVRKMVLIK
jgi:hypothetical protein